MTMFKKKVVFNGFSLTNDELFGVQRYTIEILKKIDSLITDKYEIIVLSPSKIKYNFKNIRNIVIANNFFPCKIYKFLWQYYIFNNYAKKNNAITIDLLLSLIPRCDLLAIHDCIVEKFPENANTLWKKFARYMYLLKTKYAIKTCKNIITVSNYSKKDICKMYNFSKDNIYIVNNAYQHIKNINEDDNIIYKFGLKKRNFLFSLGSRYYHKNYKWIIEAAKQNKNYIFVITGSNTQSTSDKYLEDEHINNIIFTGYLSDEEIKSLMINCKAFILPSFYEGFGIPPLEALSLGCEIIVSNTSCLPEIYGNSAHYIDPYNYNNIDIDSVLATKVGNAEVTLKKYSWEKSAKELLKIIEKVDNK